MSNDRYKSIQDVTLEWIVLILAFAIGYISFSSNIGENNYFILLFNLETFIFYIGSFLWAVEVIMGLVENMKNARKDREQSKE
jgi:hypothetical protein